MAEPHFPKPHIHFVTGRLAAPALETIVGQVARSANFDFSIDVLPITVAALMTPAWIAKRINVPPAATSVMIPGYCGENLQPLTDATQVPVRVGPKDLRALADAFGQVDESRNEYGQHDIEIIAEINQAPRLELAEIVDLAQQLHADGADVIDVGCNPGETWDEVGACVRALRVSGRRVSIDSLNPREIAPAVAAGAELVLSVNSSNRDAAADWGCEVVAIPDDPQTLAGLHETIEHLDKNNVRFRLDPVLEPIGFGFAASLGRYLEVRRQYPQAEMMMGIGNLTELTDCDSAGVNAMLIGFCQETQIRSILTTQVINWARTSVRECDLARRLMFYSVKNQLPPKHVEPDLVQLRDPKLYELGAQELERLGNAIRDHNFRIFAEAGKIHALSDHLHIHDEDPFLLFERLLAARGDRIDSSHAFYLGYEMAKAATALTLGKQYRQDEALDWGYLTVEEDNHRLGSRITRDTEETSEN